MEELKDVTKEVKDVAIPSNELTKALEELGLSEKLQAIESKAMDAFKAVAAKWVEGGDTEFLSPQDLPNDEYYAEGVEQWHSNQERIDEPQDLTEIPSEGGVNSEQRTRGELYERPYDYDNLKGNVSSEEVEAGIERTHQRTEEHPYRRGTIEGVRDFFDLRFDDFVVKLPSAQEYRAICQGRGIDPKTIDSATLRSINYDIVRKAFAEKYGCSVKEAELIIGNRLNGIIHEDKAGYAIIVPANIHAEKSAFSHTGYVERVKKEIANT
jgi:hypothetical protein